MHISSLKNRILRETGALSRCVQSISDIKFRGMSLQRGQFIFVTRICEHPGINMIDLSDMLKVDKATTTKAVQKLSEYGYVQKVRDADDKRIWHLFPTSKTQEIYPLIIAEENRNIDICFTDFTDAEKEAAYRLMRRMRKNIEESWLTQKSLKPDAVL